jgi:hypothetical protein
MKRYAIILLAFALASTVTARTHADYQNGQIVQMDSAACGVQQAPASSSLSSSQPALCREYTLEAGDVVYRIRPKDEKHAKPIVPGASAHFRLSNDKLLLESPDGSGKEREFIVVSMKPHTVTNAQLRGTL